MADVILMPRLSDTMTEGVIAAWHKKVGDPVKKGELLAEVETDKATMELESYKDGTLLHIGVDKGGKLQVNDLLAIIGKPGEDITGLVKGVSEGGVTSIDKPIAKEASGQKQEASGPKQEAKAQETGNKEQASGGAKQQPAAQKQESGGAAMDLSKMEEVILMPRLSDTMTEGVIAAWHKNVGDQVKKGDILADIETDKATMELESYKEGKLLHQGAKAGEKILVNELLAIIGDESKVDVKKILAAKSDGGGSGQASAPAENAAQQQQPAAEEFSQAINGTSTSDNGRVKASPLAKKLAAEKGIDLKAVQGSGDEGRITKKDIENFKGGEPQTVSAERSRSMTTQPSGEPSRTTAPQGQVSFDETPISQMRKVIAKRLAESKFTAPHFYLTMSIDMDKAVESRAKLNEISPVKISFNDLVLKACAVALKQHPAVNSSWLGDKIRTNHHVNIGVAVAVEDGLLVPVVRFADTKSLSQIAGEVKTFAQKAKDKKLQPQDWEGNTFTISNLGMFGIDEFTAIINPPDSCILAIGAIQQVPVVKDGQIKVGNVMKVTMSCDHRVVDGASGAAFLQTLQKLLEEPLRMLV
jgi:pyruvate dehydrogenase E2 component (dihydrolipoamide acetyltransferase)